MDMYIEFKGAIMKKRKLNKYLDVVAYLIVGSIGLGMVGGLIMVFIDCPEGLFFSAIAVAVLLLIIWAIQRIEQR